MTVQAEPNADAPHLTPAGNLAPLPQSAAWRAAHNRLKNTRPENLGRQDLLHLGHEPGVLKAIRRNCIQCQGGTEAEVRRCTQTWCPLWPYRMASDPFRRREMTEEKRAAAAARIRTLNLRGKPSSAVSKSDETGTKAVRKVEEPVR